MAGSTDQVALLCDSGTDARPTTKRRQWDFLPLASVSVLLICLLGLVILVLHGRKYLGMSEREAALRVETSDVLVAGYPTSAPVVRQEAEERSMAATDKRLREMAGTARFVRLTKLTKYRAGDSMETLSASEMRMATSGALRAVRSVQVDGRTRFTDEPIGANPTRLAEVSGPQAVYASDALQPEVEFVEENDNLENSDEVQGLLENIGEEPTDPEAVAFLLPLRGHVGDLGMRLGRRMKRVMEKSMEAEGNESQFIPSTILVRDTQCDPETTRSLTEHFYEVHGVTRYFGLLTDEEALTVALWARSKAPGTRFVSPTATSPYLERARNVATVQPSGSLLAAAVADFLLTVQARQPLVVVRASLHTDAFLSLLRLSGIRPAKVLHYYHTTNMSQLAWRVQSHLVLSSCPVILLGDAESWYLVEAVDSLISAVWILPYPTQLCDRMRTKQSELVSFLYRAHDDVPGLFLQKQPMLSPMESLLKASHWLLSGGKRRWQGSYVVAAKVAVNSVAAEIRLLGNSNGWLPLLQYDITPRGMLRRLYQELLVTRDLLKPLLSGDDCSLVIRYQEELTGESKVSEMAVHSSFPSLLVPAERGAQLHVDCRRQHADLRCSAPAGVWAPVTCHGSLQGRHVFVRECGKEVGISVAASQGCTATRGLVCRGGSSLGCMLSGLCTSLSLPPAPMYQCAGLNLDTLNLDF